MVCADHKGTQIVLKIHRLGRISFRTVKSNRDYLKNRNAQSWMYLSRLAAMKEYAFMEALREEGFPVPEPLAQSRHTIVMSLIDAFPLRQISDVPDPASLYSELMHLVLRFAKHGLIHGDFNEFNILVKEIKTLSEDGEETIRLEPVVIDFPQMVSMEHQNAEMYFDRDVECIRRFFFRRFKFTSDAPGPFFKSAKKMVGKDGAKRLDASVEASGFSKKMLKDLESAIKEQATLKENGDESDDEEYEDDSADDNEEEPNNLPEDNEESIPLVEDIDLSSEAQQSLSDQTADTTALDQDMSKLAV